LVPERLLQFAIAGSEAVPRYLSAADHPWLRTLMEEYERFAGRKQTELRERLGEPLPCYVPEGKSRLAMHVLDRLCRPDRLRSPVPPPVARAALFTEAQRLRSGERPCGRDQIVASVASRLSVEPSALLASLFADLPTERRVTLPSPLPAPSELALRANLALAQGLLNRASRISLEVEGNARAVVRQILLRRLLCTVRARPGPQTARLDISGPYSLFRRTLLYGRAIASLVPTLHACHRFELTAECVLRGRELTVRLRSADSIFPHCTAPSRYDSQLEERFARDFRRMAPDWDLIREPEPLRADECLIFPDFALQHRRDPQQRVLLEIVGFWTPQYLQAKLEHLRAARAPNLILCIDERRNCSESDLPPGVPVIFYRHRIDVRAVLAAIEGMPKGMPVPVSGPPRWLD
jgi:predicted nuclease of restriction endonuclease-like RecB superfamily